MVVDFLLEIHLMVSRDISKDDWLLDALLDQVEREVAERE